MDYDFNDYETHNIHKANHMDGPCPCRPCKTERQAVAIPVKAETGIAPREANLLPPASRVGHIHRERAHTQINEMEDGGYLTIEEAAARRDFIDQAQTSKELQDITRDLAPPSDHRAFLARYRQDYDSSQKQYFIPALSVLLSVSLIVAFLPIMVAGVEGWLHTVRGALLAGFTIPVGAAGTIISVCVLIDKWVKANKRRN